MTDRNLSLRFLQDSGCALACGLGNEPQPLRNGRPGPSPSVRVNKPTLRRNPPIWATSRQEVCESVEWFRSYQGGVYHKDGSVKGYLLSGHPADRDLFHYGGKLIISHGGGKSQTASSLADDQLATDVSIRALFNNYRHKTPLVLLVDDKYALFPYNLSSSNITYAVLGFYWITRFWPEYQSTTTSENRSGKVVRYKFCFRWCEYQGKPWWLPSTDHSAVSVTSHNTGSHVPVGTSDASHTNSRNATAIPSPAQTSTSPKLSSVADGKRTCRYCKTKSFRVYRQGWMCLYPVCQNFWKLCDGMSPLSTLEYDCRFLQLALARQRQEPSCPELLPLVPSSTTDKKGWHCEFCGHLSCRFKWEQYECSNCQTKCRIRHAIRKPCQLDLNLSFMYHKVSGASGIIFRPDSFKSNSLTGQFETFILPDNHGQIHLIISSDELNQSANEIFRLYQEQAADASLPLRRWPLKSHKCRNTFLSNYFSQNTGEPYQYVAEAANTVPFAESASAVRMACELIEQRAKEALRLRTTFNEVLSAAYLEKQKMAFHSDSERGLGPIVASLSLGSPALMHFRPKSKRGIALTLILRHGDVVVMNGSGVQTYYEHTVVPMGVRFAATARFIKSSA